MQVRMTIRSAAASCARTCYDRLHDPLLKGDNAVKAVTARCAAVSICCPPW